MKTRLVSRICVTVPSGSRSHDSGSTPGRLRVDSGVTATLMVCGSRSFWPRLMYHTSINSKSSKLSIAPTLDTHTRFLGQSLRGLRGLRGSFQVRENQNQNFQSPFHFSTCRSSNSGWSPRHPGVLDLWCPVLPHPPRHLSAAESPQRRRVTSAPRQLFFSRAKIYSSTSHGSFFFGGRRGHLVTTQISDRKKSNNRVIRTQQDVGRLLNS